MAMMAATTFIIYLLLGITDHSSHPPPDITIPPAGGSYTDPVFGTTIIRVTDESDGDLCAAAYSYWPAFNKDSTRLLVACDDIPRLYLFDPEANELLGYDGLLWGEDGLHIEFEGAYW